MQEVGLEEAVWKDSHFDIIVEEVFAGYHQAYIVVENVSSG